MAPWLTTAGCGCVVIDITRDGDSLLIQDAPIGPHKKRIPIRLGIEGRGEVRVLLEEGGRIEVPLVCRGEKAKWVIPNMGYSGFYRQRFASVRAYALVLEAVRKGKMAEVEKLGLVYDLMLTVQEDACRGDWGLGGYTEGIRRLQELVETFRTIGERMERHTVSFAAWIVPHYLL